MSPRWGEGVDASRRHDFSSHASGWSSQEDFQRPGPGQMLLLSLREEAVAPAPAPGPVASVRVSVPASKTSVLCPAFRSPLHGAPNPALVCTADGWHTNRIQNPNLKRSLGNVVFVFPLCTPEDGVGDE